MKCASPNLIARKQVRARARLHPVPKLCQQRWLAVIYDFQNGEGPTRSMS